MSFFQEFVDYIIVDGDVLKERIEHCKSSVYITPNFRCTQCGCFMKVKTRMKDAKCPIDKW